MRSSESRCIPKVRAIFFKKDDAMFWNASAHNGDPIKPTNRLLWTPASVMYRPMDGVADALFRHDCRFCGARR
jgi:hypothetical protein